MLRRSAVYLLLSCSMLVPASPASAASRASAPRLVSFDIPASTLADALNELARQSSMQISFPFDAAAGRRAGPLRGQMTPLAAAQRLTAGSDLSVVEATAGHIMLTTAAAAAQPVPVSVAETDEDIIVTGLLLASRRALDTKRRSNQIVDSISQDDVSQLPDVNVVEAARRIAGLSVIADRDPSRARDNYQYVTIRGLDSRYNLVTIDGVQVASADNSFRGAQLAFLPASLVGEIQAIKTMTAQYDPHALGGQINLVTKSAFDTDTMFTARALGGWTSQDGKVAPENRANIRADATGAVRFGANKEFGLVVSGEYQRIIGSALASLPGDSGGAGWAYYTAAGAQTGDIAASTGRAVPVRVQDYAFTTMRERYSVNGKFEFRPTDRFGVSLFGGYYNEFSDENRYEALALPAAATYVPGATADTGQLASGNYQLGLVAQPEQRRTWLFNGNMRYDLTDDLKLSGGASYSVARYNQDRWMYKWNTGMRITATSASTSNAPAFGYSYQNVNGEPIITMNDPAAAADPANYGPRYWRNIVNDIEHRVRGIRGELGWNFDPEDRGLGVQVGFNHTLTLLQNRLNYREWFPGSAASAALIGNLDRYAQPTVLTPIMAPGINFYLIDGAKAQGVLADNPGWFREASRVADGNNAFYDLREAITAGYGQIRWQSDAVNLLFGLRYDRTDVGVTTRLNGTPTEVRRDRNYAYALPSMVATWNVSPRFKLRGGVSETIGRPDYEQYGATTRMALDLSNSSRPLTISQGNPDLRPRRAWNFDLSGELYLGRGGLISAALFYKDIKDEIFTRTTQGTGTFTDGVNYPATITQPVNAASAMVRGVEVQFIKDRLDFLPGPLANLGVSLNATWLKGQFDFVNTAGVTRRIDALFNQPDQIYNASIFYVDGRFSLRAAYNRIGTAPVSVDSSSAWRDIWQDARDQVDLQASFDVTPWLQATAQVQNVTNSAFQARLGQNRELLQTRYPVGRTFWFGLILKPGR